MSIPKKQKKKEIQVHLTLSDGKQYSEIIRSVRSDGIELNEQFIKRNVIEKILVIKPSKLKHGASTGFAIGAGLGTAAWFYLISNPDMGSNISDLIIMSLLGGSVLTVPGMVIGAASGIDEIYTLTGEDAEHQWELFYKKYASNVR